eukprot:2948147-Alexandrium_andersonii.AAC.1
MRSGAQSTGARGQGRDRRGFLSKLFGRISALRGVTRLGRSVGLFGGARVARSRLLVAPLAEPGHG